MARGLTAASVSSVAVGAIAGVAVRDSRPGVRYVLTPAVVLLTGAVVVVAVPAGAHHGLLQFLLLPVFFAALAFGLSAGLLAVALGGFAGSVYLVVAGANPLNDGRLLAEAALVLLLGVTAVVLVASVRAALRDPGVRSLLMARTSSPRPQPDPLTRREIEVLQLAASGLSVRDLARLLSVSPNTVKSHLEHAYDKLGAHNRGQAIAAGLGAGCLDESAVVAASEIGPGGGSARA